MLEKLERNPGFSSLIEALFPIDVLMTPDVPEQAELDTGFLVSSGVLEEQKFDSSPPSLIEAQYLGICIKLICSVAKLKANSDCDAPCFTLEQEKFL